MKKILFLFSIINILSLQLLGQKTKDITFEKVLTLPKYHTSPSATTLKPDGTILLVGGEIDFNKTNYNHLYNHQSFWWYSPNGEIIQDYGKEGQVIDYIGTETNVARKTLLLKGGSFVNIGTYSGKGFDAVFVSKRKKDGSLDLNFGEGGYCKIDFNQAVDWNAIITDIKMLSDSSFIITGRTSKNKPKKLNEFYIAKILPNGTIDKTFGNTGLQLLTPFGETAYPFGNLAIDENENIWVVGSKKDGHTSLGELFLMKFSKDGILDTSFGKNGIFLFNCDGKGFYQTTVKFLAPDRLVIIGKKSDWGETPRIYIFEINPFEKINPNLLEHEMTLFDFDDKKWETLHDVLFLENGSILFYGMNEYDKKRESFFALVNPDKTLNTDFGNNGYLTYVAGGFKLSDVKTGCLLNQNEAFFAGSIYEQGDWDMFFLKLRLP